VNRLPIIEIVSHCYAGHYEHYASALVYSLSSLILHPPKECKVITTVCYDPTDELTWRILEWFSEPLANAGILQTYILLDLPHLGRRAIGRNIAAKASTADIVWFADVDQTYQDNILDRLVNLWWSKDAVMIFPGQIMIHKDHATGDKATKLVNGKPQLIDIDKTEFITKNYNRAIGGVQIVKGDFARKYGYLDNGPVWQKPVDRFKQCKCDIAYRQFCKEHGRIAKANLPGLYRIRHTEAAHGKGAKM